MKENMWIPPKRRKLVALVLGVFMQLAPVYVILFPRYLGALGYAAIYFGLAVIVGATSVFITKSIWYPAMAVALGKLISDTLLGWRINYDIAGHLIEVGLVTSCAAISAMAFLHLMSSEISQEDL